MSYQVSWIEENKDMICGNEYQWHVVETLEEVSRYKAWLRKNGTDVNNTMRRGGIDGESPNESPSFSRVISLDANDYIEVIVVVSNAQVSLEYDAAITTPFNGPATAAAEVTVAQIQL